MSPTELAVGLRVAHLFNAPVTRLESGETAAAAFAWHEGAIVSENAENFEVLWDFGSRLHFKA